MLRITSCARSRAFYVEGLGFTVEWEHRAQPDLPVFMSITQDGMEIFLTEHAGDCEVGGLVHFYVADVDAWYARFTVNQVHVYEPPGDRLPGLRYMTVADPDSNQLRFLTRLNEGSSVPDRDGVD